jgi:large subunit ribosomal protein L3
MEKLTGKKLKMDQLFKEDRVVPITPIKIETGDLSILKTGDLVKVSGITKGHGFQGVVKRHGFSGGPKTHGQKNRHRAPGSIGNTTPQRVIPGRRMAGHMGVERVTIKNLKVVDINADNKMVILRGAVPGNNGGKVEIRK